MISLPKHCSLEAEIIHIRLEAVATIRKAGPTLLNWRLICTVSSIVEGFLPGSSTFPTTAP